MAKKKATKAAKITGEAVGQMADLGQIPPVPLGALDGVPGAVPNAPVMIRRGGRLVPLDQGVPMHGLESLGKGPAHSAMGRAPLPAGYPLGMDAGPGNVSFDHYETGAGTSGRKFNPTFHEPPHEVLHARGMAQALRVTLGQTITQMEMAYHEALRLLKQAKKDQVLQAECAREGLDLALVQAFAGEVDDVLRIFVPVEAPEG